MGTRSLTYVYERKAIVCCMYRQMDGYPSGHGADLADILDGMHIVNGFSPGDHRRVANGAGCLAAQIVADFKVGVGNIYLYPTSTKKAGQDYEYHIYVTDNETIQVKVKSGSTIMYFGDVPGFVAFCKEDET